MKNKLTICQCPNNIIAEKLTIKLIKSKLSTYITILKNIQLIYRYNKKIYKDNGCYLLIKTPTPKQLITYIKKIYPYNYLEIITINYACFNQKKIKKLIKTTQNLPK